MPAGDDVRAAAQFVADTLVARGEAWDARPQALHWTCRETLVHVVRCLTNYGALLSRTATGRVAIPEMGLAPPGELLDAMISSAFVLGSVVTAARSDDRAYHPAGMADPSGFAAMGCDEILVHGADVAQVLGIPYRPPPQLCERVLRRLFPWTPEPVDPWEGLLWANGRTALGDVAPDPHWVWHCAPLEEWDGEIPRWEQ